MGKLLLGFLMFISIEANAVGYQHGVFRSQATQGPAWTGTATIVEERFVITVFPDYLDVEMDWEFTIGGTKPGQHEKALEIVGNINLEASASIIGLLAWYQGKILKGKLKTTAHARKEYEEVVDRNSPVPPKPRDPVLVERSFHKDLKDNYDISIFPVEWGGTRKIRIRYLVPATAGRIGYPHAFTNSASVVVKPGIGIERYIIQSADGSNRKYGGPSLELHKEDFRLTPQAWNILGSNNPQWVRPSLSDSSGRSILFTGSFSGKVLGNLAHAYLSMPASLMEDIDAPGPLTTFATLKSGSDSVRKEVGHASAGSSDMETLRIYSLNPLEASVIWQLYSRGELVRKIEETPMVLPVEDAPQYARSFGIVPFYPMAKTMPRSLGVIWGFVDDWYSLVALESDALPDALATQIADHGLPVLEPWEIHPEVDENYAVPTVDWVRSRKLDVQTLLFPQLPRLVSIQPRNLPDGMRLEIGTNRIQLLVDSGVLGGGEDLECSIHGLDGRIIRKWRRADLASGRLSWSPEEAGLGSGTYILRVTHGKVRFVKVVVLGHS